MKSPFAINVSTIAGKPGSSLDAEAKGLLPELFVSGSRVDNETPVSFTGEVRSIDGGIEAEGDVVSAWVGECRRCLGEASGDINVHTRELFEREPTEGETYGIDGDNVNLEPLVREAVMLELPEAPLCRPDCAGLCPVCGVNKNETECGHTVVIADDRWAALDALKNN